jgi:hypothetical protein
MRLAATYLVLVAFALSPLYWVSIPPLVDYPIHLARMQILAHAADMPALAANYRPAWRLLPNLSMDLIVPGLMHFLSLEAAGRLFIALTLALLVLGTAALRRALQGEIGYWPLLSLLFLYNGGLFWALLNFLFALGIVLLAFGLWLTSSGWRPSLRLFVFAALACLIFILHLFAFGLYGLLIGGYELGQWRSGSPRGLRPLLVRSMALVQFGPSLLLWLISLENGGPTLTAFGTVRNKLYAAAAPAYFGTPALWLGVVIFVVCLAAAGLAWRARIISVAPAMRWPLALVLLAAILMPTSLDGSSLADLRLPVALPFLLVASLRVGAIDRHYLAGWAGALLLLLGLRVFMVSESWRETDRSFAEFRHDAATMPEGVRLLVARDAMPAGWRWPNAEAPSWIRPDYQSFDHMAMLAIIDRGAFVPGMITRWTAVEPTVPSAELLAAQGYSLTPDQLAAGEEPECQAGYWCDWPRKFDYLLWIDFGHAPAALPAHLQVWAQGSFFTLYRIAG